MRKCAVAILLLGTIAGISGCSRRSSSTQPAAHSFVVSLPDGWYEVGKQSPRLYRRRETGAGSLQISLQPPLGKTITTGPELEQEFLKHLERLGPDLGERWMVTNDVCQAGLLATAMYKSPKYGFMQFWVIHSDVSVFATYIMGSLDTVAVEGPQAGVIVKSIRIK